MTKINILKTKSNGKRAGDFYLRKSGGIRLRLNVGFQKLPKFEKELLKLLSSYFDIIELNQTSSHKGRGSLTRSKRYNYKPLGRIILRKSKGEVKP